MVPALLALKHAVDLAIAAVQPLEGVLAAWEATRENGAEEPAPAQEGTPTAPTGSGALYEAPRPRTEPSETTPTPGLFDPLPGPAPAERRATNGANPLPTRCERTGCQAEVAQTGRGARRRYCSEDCRRAAAAERAAQRAAEVELDPGPLPDQVERPFAMSGHPDDARSDPAALAGPRLPWELEAGAS